MIQHRLSCRVDCGLFSWLQASQSPVCSYILWIYCSKTNFILATVSVHSLQLDTWKNFTHLGYTAPSSPALQCASLYPVNSFTSGILTLYIGSSARKIVRHSCLQGKSLIPTFHYTSMELKPSGPDSAFLFSHYSVGGSSQQACYQKTNMLPVEVLVVCFGINNLPVSLCYFRTLITSRHLWRRSYRRVWWVSVRHIGLFPLHSCSYRVTPAGIVLLPYMFHHGKRK